MSFALAWRNLQHERVRTSIAIAGVTFAVVLILMQLGFYRSAERTATLIYDQLNFDLLISSPTYQHLSWPGTFAERRIVQARGIEGVARVEPLWLGFQLWKPIQSEEISNDDTSERRRTILLLGIDPQGEPFRIPELQQQLPLVQPPGKLLIDRQSRPEFGSQTAGNQTELNGKRVELVGQFTLGTGFSADGAVVSSAETLGQLMQTPLHQVSLGLVQLRPGENVEQAAANLRAVLPRDVIIRTRAQVASDEVRHWVGRTAVGTIFSWGAGIAFVVGIAIVYQVLSSDITYRLAEYATLRAMGYSAWFLFGVVLQQAWMLAVLGFIPAYFIAQVLYALTRQLARIPMELDVWLAGFVLVLTILMCSVSGLAALRKLQAADPADLF